MEPAVQGQINSKHRIWGSNPRSLLPREALIDHLGITVYPEVLCRFRIR
jgi:hypothetical protein